MFYRHTQRNHVRTTHAPIQVKPMRNVAWSSWLLSQLLRRSTMLSMMRFEFWGMKWLLTRIFWHWNEKCTFKVKIIKKVIFRQKDLCKINKMYHFTVGRSSAHANPRSLTTASKSIVMWLLFDCSIYRAFVSSASFCRTDIGCGRHAIHEHPSRKDDAQGKSQGKLAGTLLCVWFRLRSFSPIIVFR